MERVKARHTHVNGERASLFFCLEHSFKEEMFMSFLTWMGESRTGRFVGTLAAGYDNEE